VHSSLSQENDLAYCLAAAQPCYDELSSNLRGLLYDFCPRKASLLLPLSQGKFIDGLYYIYIYIYYNCQMMIIMSDDTPRVVRMTLVGDATTCSVILTTLESSLMIAMFVIQAVSGSNTVI
jgi:hypothetical protein